jgi:hypothetical protein
MGYGYAAGLMEQAELSEDFDRAREVAVRAHLAGNCFPPMGEPFVRPALDAIEAAESGDWEDTIDLPTVSRTAGQVVSLLRLDAFIRTPEEDFDFGEDPEYADMADEFEDPDYLDR